MINRVFVLAYAQIDIKNCLIKIKDNGANILTVKIGEGNINYTEKRNMTYYKDRGLLDTVREGDQEPVDVKLDFTWEFLRHDSADPGAATPTVEEALKKIGAASGWVSTATDTCEPYCVDIQVLYNPPCAGVKDELILLADFRWEQLDHDLRGGTVSITGKCNVTNATVTRTGVSTNL